MNATTPKSVFLGMTGASGAAYGLRLLAGLVACGCDVTLCVSDSGLLVVREELELVVEGREATVAALLARAGAPAAVRVVDPADIGAPAASGSAAPDAAVVCPCTMSSAAHIALGTSRNLIHRVADVALKERRPLVVVPRETPLSVVHLRRLLELAEAGAIVLPAMPGFYVRPTSVDDLVDHIAGKVLQALGFEQHLFRPWDGGVR
ncbi:MAG TPA: UbiX family flavin prenyltransferase [Thermoleophilia bacterium]|nr:UbiX family flavin prenyltransferase [Thermoleophilia bacterium]